MQTLRLQTSAIFFTGPFFFETPNQTPPPLNCTPFWAAYTLDTDTANPLCTFRDEDIRLLSYQGICEAFNQLLVGSVRLKLTGSASTTIVGQTVFSQTEELDFLRDSRVPYRVGMIYDDLQSHIFDRSRWSVPGLQNPQCRVLEEVSVPRWKNSFEILRLACLLSHICSKNAIGWTLQFD